MSGFIYIWYDKKHARFYVGSHWGTEDDGYVCSSSWMLQAYKKRPQDFKRRILERFDDRSKINEIEHRWLQMIKPEELRTRYYNFHNRRFGHWASDERSRMTVGQKISHARLNMSDESRDSYRGRDMKKYVTDEMREKCRQARAKQIITPEQRAKMSKSHTGKRLSEETRAKIGAAGKGRKHSEETKRKMRESHAKRHVK